MTNFSLSPQPLFDSDIHVWCASLNVSSKDLLYYRSILSEDEVGRAMRFVFEKDRIHFIVGRGLLRTMLSRYLHLEPVQIEFVYGPYGKPGLKPELTVKCLEFNLSHSKGLALYALTWNRKIGVDVECIQPMPNMNSFAELYFSPRETAYINALSGHEKEQAFFKIWTGKEAFLKANGSGLTEPLNEVEIYLETWKTFTPNTRGKDKPQTKRWRLEMFDPAPGHQAALVVEGDSGQITFMDF